MTLRYNDWGAFFLSEEAYVSEHVGDMLRQLPLNNQFGQRQRQQQP